MCSRNEKTFFLLRKPLTFFSLLLVLFIFPLTAYSTTENHVELTLQDAIAAALGDNLDIRIAEFTPQIRHAEIGEKQGRFDPELSFENTTRYKEEQTANRLAGAAINENRNFNSTLTLRQLIKTGAIYEINFYNDRNSTNSEFVLLDPHYTSELTLDVEQPLFKNRGADIQESKINIAKNFYKSSLLDLDSEKEIVVNDVEKKYWDLYNAYNELDVARLSLKLAQTLYEVSKARIEAGVLAPIEILVSEAEIAARETDILDAEKDVGDSDDQLKAAMNYERWDIQFIPSDRPRPFGDPPDLDKEITEAFEQRKDFKQSFLDKDSKEISVNLAKNQTLADFSLVGSVGLNGLRNNYDDNIKDTFKGDYYSWKAGFVFRMPLGNKEAKSRLIKARAEDRQAIEKIDRVKQNIIVEVREAVRAVNVALKKINATIKSEALAKKRYENEQEKFKVGMSTAHDVLDFQESYAQALSDKNTSVVEYAKASADLKLVKKVGRERINQGDDIGQETTGTTQVNLPETQRSNERQSLQLFNR